MTEPRTGGTIPSMTQIDMDALTKAAVETENRVVSGLDAATYHLMTDRTSSSDLAAIDESPALYKHKRGRDLDCDAFRIGRAFHTAALQPDMYDSEYVIWTGKARRGGVWNDFSAEHAGTTILTAAQHGLATKMAEAVRCHPVAAPLLCGESEVSFFWLDQDTGEKMKCRADHLSHAIIELKSCKDASPHGVQNAVVRYRYDLRMAVYADGVTQVLREALPLKAIFVEKTPPYHVVVYDVPDEVLMVGREKRDAAIKTLVECRKSDVWPGLEDGKELTLTLPVWAQMEAEDDALTFGGAPLNF